MKHLLRLPPTLLIAVGLLFIQNAPTVTSASPVASSAVSAAGKSSPAKSKEQKAKEKAAKAKAAKEKAAKEKAAKEAAAKAAAEAKAKKEAERLKALCLDAIQQRPIYAPKGLVIACVPKGDANLHGSDGYSMTSTVTERVWISDSNARPLNMVAHEFAHGWAWQVMSPALRLAFAKDVGKKSWTDGSYEVRPSEVWAYNQGRCHGYPLNFGYKKVDCSLIAAYEAKVAGQ